MNLPTLPAATFAWDQYWRDGRLASCGGEGGINYQSDIATGWQRFFLDTLSDGMRLLDICTGNGAIARLAAAVASTGNLHVAIDAVDAAVINPEEPGPGTGMIRFSPRTPAEALPFDDATFNVIVGQYAIEYTDVERSLAELARVSLPTAAVRFVTHAAGSIVVQATHRQLTDAQNLTRTGVFEAADALARACASSQDAAHVDAARGNFQHALRALREAATHAEDLRMYRNTDGVLVHALQQQARVGTEPVLAKIAEMALAIKAHEARLTAMRHAALDDEAARALCSRAEQMWGRTFQREPLTRADGAILGWVVASPLEH